MLTTRLAGSRGGVDRVHQGRASRHGRAARSLFVRPSQGVTFLDTGFLFALVSERDAHHGRVVEVFNTFKSLRPAHHLLTTNHVIADTVTLTLKIGHGKAVALGEQLYADKLARIHRATPDEERTALAYFKRHQDQAYSFVDCLSFVVMEEVGIQEAL